MSKKEALKIFDNNNVRVVWDDEQQEWYFCVVDVIEVLTDSINPTDYLKKMRKRDPELNVYMGTNCPQVLMTTPTGKRRKTLGYGQNADVAKRGGNVAKAARNQLESQLGHSVVTSLNAKDYFKSIEQKENEQLDSNSDDK
jgi:hypothetical protein